ncbi:hypothetical protein [Kitasatospora sp. NPDC088351]|uniref:hypothetical protein n=1 Tax=unclassified Kitasatospora TaxID=2633591 RepID=UPI003444B614
MTQSLGVSARPRACRYESERICADNGPDVTAVGAQEAASPGQVLFACPRCAPAVRAVFAIGDDR